MKKNHYVKNKDLIPEIMEYKKTGKVSEELGRMIMAIAGSYVNRSWFIRYSTEWKEDMISGAVETCLRYMHNFDLEKSNNPFSYISQIVHNSFRQFIQKQDKHSDLKDLCYKRYNECEQEEAFNMKGINYKEILEG